MTRVRAPREALDRLVASCSNYRQVRWLRTGIAAIDLVAGNGFPLGRFVEVIGDPSTCKTALALAVCAAAIREGGGAAYLDPEAKVDSAFAARFVPWEKILYRVPRTLQETFDRALGMARDLRRIYPKGPVVIVLDSIAAAALDREIEEIEKHDAIRLTGEVGTKARALTMGFPVLLHECWKKDILFLGVNHLKIHMGAYFHSFLESPGGRAIWYHAALRLVLRQKGRLRDENGAVTGIEIQAEAIKNNVSSPYRRADGMRFDFQRGWDPWIGATGVLVRAGRVAPSRKHGWFAYDGIRFRERDLGIAAGKKPALIDGIP